MREWCNCGASIRARRSDVLAWRDNHRHETPAEDEPQRQGAHAQVESAAPRYFEHDSPSHDMPIINARTIGFTRE